MTSSIPVPERSLNRQVVLEEDEYTDALSHIIARDFFPSLVHLDAANDYLSTLDTQDPHLIGASVRRLEEINNTPATRRRKPSAPSQTPYGADATSETPLRTPREPPGPPAKRPRYDMDMSLDVFQARYTSEDNSSFTQILDEENRQRKERWGWAWEAQRKVEAQREKMLEGREKMLIEAPPVTGVREKFVIEAPTVAGLITDGREKEADEMNEKGGDADSENTSKEVVLKDEQGEDTAEVDVMAPKKDTRPAGVDGWKFKTRNPLMFPPDADESPYHPRSSAVVPPDPKAIKHGNTRLPEQEESSSASRAPPSPTRSRIEAAITDTPYRPRSPPNSSFSFVPSIPSPTPSELGPAAVNQLMTWGKLTATPRIISSSDKEIPTPTTPFRIAPPSSRESLSYRLSTDAARSLRAKAGLLAGSGAGGKTSMSTLGAQKGSMGPPSWTPRRTTTEAAGNLTPAARRLLDRTTMGTASRRAETMGRTSGWDSKATDKEQDLGKVRWTPTPNAITRKS